MVVMVNNPPCTSTPEHRAPEGGPVRFQLSRAKGWKMPENTAAVDRRTRFGNPFLCTRPYGCPHSPDYDHGRGEDGSPEMTCCVDTFRLWVEQGLRGEESRLIGRGGGICAALMAASGNARRTKLVESLHLLRGKNLACWCKLPEPGQPDVCHAAVLLELANK